MKLKNKMLLSCVGIAFASTIAYATQPDQASMLEMLYGQATSGQPSYSVQPGVVKNAVQPAVQTATPATESTEKYSQPTKTEVEPSVTESVQPIQAQTAEPAKTETTVTQADKPYFSELSLSEAQEKVDAIGYKLLANSQLTNLGVTFKVSDEPTINAYADGNRNVVIFTGLLQLCESDDELAAILSHEIAHINGAHIAKGNVSNVAVGVGATVAKKKLSGLRAKVAKVAKEYGAEELGISSDLVGTAVDAAGTAAVSYHARAHEVDADTDGMTIMKNAGYNPMAAIAIIYKIGDNYNDIFVDHPSTDKRVEKMYNHASENFPTAVNAGYNSKYYNEAIYLMKKN